MSFKSLMFSRFFGFLALVLSGLTLLAGAAIAQEEQEQAEEAPASEAPIEEVVVTGIRSSLEDALGFKRAASSIVDHITAEDIGSLPALDLGEALQAVPGVQIVADESQRTSSINLRGLSGGYVITTADGFGIASPSLSTSETGAPNPFGAFEPSIFRGITVIKTPTADLPTGAIAGIVDQKLPKALAIKRDRFEVNVGSRYEELADNYDGEISFRARKELIEDKLAIAGTYAQSEQNFRRDSLNITRYEDAVITSGNATNRSRRVFVGPDGETLDEWKAANGIPDAANVLIMSEVRQFSELAEGDRHSYALNVAWEPTEELAFNLDFLGTEKDLEDATSDVFIFGLREGNAFSNYTPTPGVAPIFAFTDEDGTENYLITDYTYDNAQYFPGARLTDRFEKSDGVFLKGEWARDKLTMSFGAAKSDAEASSFSTQFDARYRPADRRPGGSRSPDDTNGITGRAVTGSGDLDAFLLTMEGTDNLTLSNAFQYPLNPAVHDRPHEILDRLLTQSSVSSIGDNPDGTKNRTFFLVTSQERIMSRKHEQFNLDFEYDLDIPVIDSVKVGAFHSKEEYFTRQLRPTAAFINLEGITDDLLVPAVHTQGNAFFDGNLPGALTTDQGWLTIDTQAAVAALTEGIERRYNEVYAALLADPTVEEGNTAPDALTNAQKQQAIEFYKDPVFTDDGFLARRRDNDNTAFHSSEVDIEAAYLMANFSGELGGMAYRGNAGLRYAETKTSGSGLVQAARGNGARLWDNTYELSTPSHSYSNTLPSINLSLDIREDLVLRTAYYEGISRPNVAAFRPNGIINEGDRAISIRIADTILPAFEADSFDISLNWYNRSGSVVSLGYFQKDVRDQSDLVQICPADGGGLGYGTLTLVGSGASAICEQDELHTIFIPDDPDTPEDESGTEQINREVTITQRVNKSDEQTVKGYEFAVQQNLDFLPGFWSHFGGMFNFSRVTNDGERIPGISERQYNIVGYYETDRFNARLAYNYRSEYLLATTGTFTGFADRDAKDRKRLDFSTSYEVLDNLRVTFRAYNLLDDIFEEFQGRNQALGRRANYDGRVYSLAVRYVF